MSNFDLSKYDPTTHFDIAKNGITLIVTSQDAIPRQNYPQVWNYSMKNDYSQKGEELKNSIKQLNTTKLELAKAQLTLNSDRS